ncbi:hypothetical protein LEMLEM_LOCUS15785, partial [Lemmus lemmus]
GYRVAARLGTSSLIKTGLSNQSGSRAPKSRQESEAAPAPSARSPTRRRIHTTATHVQRAQVSPTQVPCSVTQSPRNPKRPVLKLCDYLDKPLYLHDQKFLKNKRLMQRSTLKKLVLAEVRG